MINTDESYCRSCGEVIKKEAEICPKCGVRQITNSGYKKSRMVAFFLAFFFGWAGIHKFYLGQSVAGLFYLLCTVSIIFCWATFILCVIDCLKYLVQSDEAFERDNAPK